MKIAIDVDGVITEAPELFAAISKGLKDSGHYICILTDFDEAYRTQREKELAEYGICYDELIITGDKAEYCIENSIDYAFDDLPEYYMDHSRTPINIINLKE